MRSEIEIVDLSNILSIKMESQYIVRGIKLLLEFFGGNKSA